MSIIVSTQKKKKKKKIHTKTEDYKFIDLSSYGALSDLENYGYRLTMILSIYLFFHCSYLHYLPFFLLVIYLIVKYHPVYQGMMVIL